MPETSGGVAGLLGIDKFIPNFDIGTMGLIIIWILGVLLVGLFVGIAIYFAVMYKKYNQKIVVFAKVGNKPYRKLVTKGMFQAIGRAGDRVLILKKPKGKTLANPTLQMGRNEWWYWEGKDGEWLNVVMKNVDIDRKKINMHFVNADMRLERLALEKQIDSILSIPQKFWDKYGDKIVNLLFYLFLTICLVVLFMRLEGVANALTQAVQAQKACQVQPQAANPQRPVGDIVPALVGLVIFKFKKGKWG